MPNINAVLNEQIRRLARREIRGTTKAIKRAGAQHRRDIAALKRSMAQLLKQVVTLKRQLPDQPAIPPAEAVQGSRLRIDGLKAHRARLGLSAKDYGKLMGVSGLTIYNWEAGKSKPRRSQLPRIVAVRGIGKREAIQRLGMGEKPNVEISTKTPPKGTRKRGKFERTGEESILLLLKGRKSLRTSQINDAWKKEGRGGTANVTLGKLVKARRIKRTKVKGQRGSEYSGG
jgi:DNA-binding transcriptional regulator YiaG